MRVFALRSFGALRLFRWQLIGPKDVDLVVCGVTLLANLIRSALRPIEAVVEFAISGFGHRLMQVSLNDIAGRMIRRQRVSQGPRFVDSGHAIFLGRLVIGCACFCRGWRDCQVRGRLDRSRRRLRDFGCNILFGRKSPQGGSQDADRQGEEKGEKRLEAQNSGTRLAEWKAGGAHDAAGISFVLEPRD
ncbi:hypothetical protein MJC1_01956 [Methylocystis sp. MJC1]|nr:hypothetical protein MJC1_01956 [Methylocystis sp. MJC1]